MRRLQQQWGYRHAQMSKKPPIMTRDEWIMFWAVVVIGSIITVVTV